MNEILYISLLIYLYILFVVALFLIPYAIIKIKKRIKNCIYISKFFMFFGCFCIFIFYIIFIGAIHINKIDFQSNNILFLMISMLIYATLGVVQLWMWTHYEIQIQEDKFIYSNLFYGKKIIKFNDIDISNSRYIFVYPKGKRDFGHEVLELKMKDGKQYSFKFDDFLQGGDSLLMTNTIIFKLKIEREGIYK